jgi:capsular polysaccharide biosynthesis protein
VELSEVLSRIFGRHRILVIGLVVIGLLGGLALHWADEPDYRGTARLVATASEPTTAGEATAIADTVRALATGPALVRAAIQSIGADRDPSSVAAHAVNVRGLGSSGVVELQVTDRDPRVAVQLTEAIAKAVVSQRISAASAGLTHEIAVLQQQIQRLEAQVADLDGRLSELSDQAGSPDPTVANTAIAGRDQLLAERSSLTDQIGVLLSNKTDLTGELAAQSPATIVDPPQSPATRVSPQRLSDAALGALLGLILAVAIAAALETLRPTVVGRAAIARSLQTAVLGDVRRSGTEWDPGDVLEAASHVGLAAAGASAKRVDFMSTSPQINVSQLAAAVGDELKHLSVEVATPDAIVGRVVSAEATGSSGRGSSNGRRPVPQRGLVLVVPEAVKQADLEPARDFLAICGWPLLGVIIAQRNSPLTLVRREATPSPITSEASA